MSSDILSALPLDHEFLPTRAKILEIAAALDRIERAAAISTRQSIDDPRWEQLRAGIGLLLTAEADRARQVQLLFSRPYDQQWRENLEMTNNQ